MSADFYRATIPEPRILLGVQLKPFSAGHLVILHRMASVFVADSYGGSPPSMEDLVAAVFVCSLTWRENLEVFHTGTLDRWRFGPLVYRESVRDFQVRWQRKVGLFDFAEKFQDFAAYLKEGCAMPTYATDDTSDGVGKCPPVQLVKVALITQMGMREETFMDRPWALSLWDYMTLMAGKGALRFEDEEHLAAMQKQADEFGKKMEEMCRGSN